MKPFSSQGVVDNKAFSKHTGKEFGEGGNVTYTKNLQSQKPATTKQDYIPSFLEICSP